MAGGASKRQGIKKKLPGFVIKAALFVACLIAGNTAMNGAPLFGLPKTEEITRIEITLLDSGASKYVTEAKDVELARKAAGLLRFVPFSEPQEEAPRVAVAFVTRAGGRISLAAGLSCVEYKGRLRELKQKKLFVNVIEGIFFKERHEARRGENA